MRLPFVRSSVVERLQSQIAQLQHAITIHTAQTDDETATYRGTAYVNYANAVQELSRKYTGRANWGVQISGSVIDLRAAFIISNGIEAVIAPEATREREFIETFLDWNDLNGETPLQWAREGEIEGKCLVRLFWNAERKTVDVRFIPWTQHAYTIETANDDYADYVRAKYRVNGTGAEVVLVPDKFVFVRFGGRTHEVNETMPKLGRVLADIEALDKALRDWREINRFMLPTPVIECTDARAAQSIWDWIRRTNWKLSKLLVLGGGTYKVAGMNGDALSSLEKEIVTHAKIISGATGVPVHFLGLPDLMSNRSTAENLMESVQASTMAERGIWRGFYEELFRKAVAMANENLQSDMDPNAVSATIPQASSAKLAELTSVWLPLYMAGAISIQTFLTQVPGIDVDAEIALIEAAKPAVTPFEGDLDDPEEEEEDEE